MKGAGKLCDSTRLTQSPVTRTMSQRSTRPSPVPSKRRKTTLQKRSLNPLLTLNLSILSLVICSGPFVAPRHGSVTPRHSPGQGDQQTVFNANRAEPVSLVARSSTGDLSAHSTRTGPKQPSLKQNSDIKDEYSLYCNFVDSEHNLTHDYFEYEEGQCEIIVKSRLKNHIQFWIDIQAYDYILDVIQNGYIIPFFTTPPSTVLSNNKSSLRHSAFVLEAIHDLLIKGLIEECSHRPTVVNPLTVSVQNSGKKRLILDLHLWKASVKFEDIRTAML